jgi:DNA polymerase I-like protein with 3'-5' exonuclease and polymerase domains
VSAAKAAKNNGWLQIPLVAPPITWKATPVSQLPTWNSAKRICLDVECRDDHLYELGPGVRRGGYVCGIAFAIEDGPAHYLPIRHEGGGNLSADEVWAYVRDQAREFSGDVVWNMGPYDLDYLWENKVAFPKVRRHLDVQNAEPILDEFQKTYGLDAICARRGLPGKDETELRAHAKAWGVDPKTGLWRLHAGAVGRYAEQDVRAPLGLMCVQEKELKEQGLSATFDLECQVMLPLVRMTRRGIRVDLDELDRVEAWANERLGSYIDQIHHLTGVRIGSISNATECARALKARGLDVEMRVRKGTGAGTGKPEKREPSITKLWLQQQTDDVAKAIISAREFAKLKGTYINGVREHLVGDRLHPSWKQLRGASDEDEDEDDEGGARFGRCSARHTNVQASMKRSKEIMKRWRKVYIADEGKEWISGDFSQQEPRWTIHYSEICCLPGSRAAGNTLRTDPLYDCYQMLVELVKSEKDTDLKKLRDELKEVYLGRCYGMGGGKLAKKLRLPTVWKMNDRIGKPYEAAGPEAQAIIDRFDRGVPYVKALARLCTKSAQSKGYILGVDDRRVRFELMNDGRLKDEHKALNKLIQYAAAYQTKKALVALDAEGYPLQKTVHDEFDYSEDDLDRARHMGEVMCEVHQLRVPSRVDLKKGRSYGELETFCTVTSKGFNLKEVA